MIALDPFSIALGIMIGAAIGGWKATHRWRDAMDLTGEEDEKKAPAAATAGDPQDNIFNDYSLPRLESREQRAA